MQSASKICCIRWTFLVNVDNNNNGNNDNDCSRYRRHRSCRHFFVIVVAVHCSVKRHILSLVWFVDPLNRSFGSFSQSRHRSRPKCIYSVSASMVNRTPFFVQVFSGSNCLRSAGGIFREAATNTSTGPEVKRARFWLAGSSSYVTAHAQRWRPEPSPKISIWFSIIDCGTLVRFRSMELRRDPRFSTVDWTCSDLCCL